MPTIVDSLIERATPFLSHKKASVELSEWAIDVNLFVQKKGKLTSEVERYVTNCKNSEIHFMTLIICLQS